MPLPQEHSEALGQLQTSLNRTLEETGRLFAAMISNPNSPPASQAARLKSLLPVAEKNFNGALDNLELELQRAMRVMRRDLAVCRELSGAQISQPAPSQSQPPAQASEAAHGLPQQDEASAPVAKDTTMTDNAPEKNEKPQAADKSPSVPATAAPAPEATSESKPTTQEDTKPEAAPATDSKATMENSEPPPNGLPSIDTSAEQSKPQDQKHTDEEKPPDTANDLDSLFNDPMSGGAGANADFSFDQDGSGNDMDFGSFGGDNDNISSLLPGLEDYANTQPNSNANEVDLDQLFGLSDNNQNAGDMQGGTGEQQDTTFDDLMDLANFDTGMDGDNGNGNNNTANNDLDFDSLFS